MAIETKNGVTTITGRDISTFAILSVTGQIRLRNLGMTSNLTIPQVMNFIRSEMGMDPGRPVRNWKKLAELWDKCVDGYCQREGIRRPDMRAVAPVK